jgi:hypothetical protein
MFISDSGKESSLKLVCESVGLSVIIFLEHESKRIDIINDAIPSLSRFDIVFQSKRFALKNREFGGEFKKF